MIDIDEMYDKLIASPERDEKIKSLLYAYTEGLEDMKEYDHEAYNKAMKSLKLLVNGYHFDDELYEESNECMVNDDGTRGHHYTTDAIKSAMDRMGISCKDYNLYDFSYAVNMFYSDYHSVLGSEIATYIKMANAFLKDVDSKSGKALRYFLAMKN